VPTNPWAFGWTQLLTLLGFAITIAIAIGGFRTFGKWRREKLEEKRIEVAIEALATAYETKTVFNIIRRRGLVDEYEFADLPETEGESPEKRRRRGTYYAAAKRLNGQRDFFEKVYLLQARVMAVFGAQTEEIFELLHDARTDIQVAISMLMESVEVDRYRDETTKEMYRQMRIDYSGIGAKLTDEGDRVARKVDEFRSRIEALCRPIIDREYIRAEERRRWLAKFDIARASIGRFAPF
jgi:hypothetical protein